MILDNEILKNLFHSYGYDYYIVTEDPYTIIKYASRYDEFDKFTLRFRKSYVYDDLIFIGAYNSVKIIKKDDLYLILEKIITGEDFNSHLYIFDTNINRMQEDADFNFIDNNDYIIIVDDNKDFYHTGFICPYMSKTYIHCPCTIIFNIKQYYIHDIMINIDKIFKEISHKIKSYSSTTLKIEYKFNINQYNQSKRICRYIDKRLESYMRR